MKQHVYVLNNIHINSADDRIVHGETQNMYSSYITNTHIHTHTEWRHCTPLLELSTTSTWVTHLATAPFHPSTFSVQLENSFVPPFLKGRQRSPLVWLNGEHFSEKKCLFLLLLVYYVYQLLRRGNVYRWRTQDMHFDRAPFLFNRDFVICARAYLHTVSAHCCFYWCCPSCTFIRQVIYPQSQKFKIHLNFKINSFDESNE